MVVLGSVLTQVVASACSSEGLNFPDANADGGSGGCGCAPTIVVSKCDKITNTGRHYALAIFGGRSVQDLVSVHVSEYTGDGGEFAGTYGSKILGEIYLADQQVAAPCSLEDGDVTFVLP